MKLSLFALASCLLLSPPLQPLAQSEAWYILQAQKTHGGEVEVRIHFPIRNFTIDHVIPRSRGGDDHLDNLQLLCGACNSLKGDRPQEYLFARMRANVKLDR